MSTKTLQNTLQLSVTREDLAAADPSLARSIITALLDSPKPQPDEHGIAPYRELWISFARRGSQLTELPQEASDSDYTQCWLNALTLISPSERFLQDFQDSLQTDLRSLFEPTEHLPQQDAVLYRIVAS